MRIYATVINVYRAIVRLLVKARGCISDIENILAIIFFIEQSWQIKEWTNPISNAQHWCQYQRQQNAAQTSILVVLGVTVAKSPFSDTPIHRSSYGHIPITMLKTCSNHLNKVLDRCSKALSWIIKNNHVFNLLWHSKQWHAQYFHLEGDSNFHHSPNSLHPLP